MKTACLFLLSLFLCSCSSSFEMTKTVDLKAPPFSYLTPDEGVQIDEWSDGWGVPFIGPGLSQNLQRRLGEDQDTTWVQSCHGPLALAGNLEIGRYDDAGQAKLLADIDHVVFGFLYLGLDFDSNDSESEALNESIAMQALLLGLGHLNVVERDDLNGTPIIDQQVSLTLFGLLHYYEASSRVDADKTVHLDEDRRFILGAFGSGHDHQGDYLTLLYFKIRLGHDE